jgi:hypothetical protein
VQRLCHTIKVINRDALSDLECKVIIHSLREVFTFYDSLRGQCRTYTGSWSSTLIEGGEGAGRSRKQG